MMREMQKKDHNDVTYFTYCIDKNFQMSKDTKY